LGDVYSCLVRNALSYIPEGNLPKTLKSLKSWLKSRFGTVILSPTSEQELEGFLAKRTAACTIKGRVTVERVTEMLTQARLSECNDLLKIDDLLVPCQRYASGEELSSWFAKTVFAEKVDSNAFIGEMTHPYRADPALIYEKLRMYNLFAESLSGDGKLGFPKNRNMQNRAKLVAQALGYRKRFAVRGTGGEVEEDVDMGSPE
jgi:hypothetical protein